MRHEPYAPYVTTAFVHGKRVRHVLFVRGRKDQDLQSAVALCGATPETTDGWKGGWLGHGASWDLDQLRTLRTCKQCAAKVARFREQLDRAMAPPMTNEEIDREYWEQERERQRSLAVVRPIRAATVRDEPASGAG